MTDTTVDPVAELKRALKAHWDEWPMCGASSEREYSLGALGRKAREHIPAVLTRLDAAERELAREHQLLLNAQDAIREVSKEAERAEREVERLREAIRTHIRCDERPCSQCADRELCEDYALGQALEGQEANDAVE